MYHDICDFAHVTRRSQLVTTQRVTEWWPPSSEIGLIDSFSLSPFLSPFLSLPFSPFLFLYLWLSRYPTVWRITLGKTPILSLIKRRRYFEEILSSVVYAFHLFSFCSSVALVRCARNGNFCLRNDSTFAN